MGLESHSLIHAMNVLGDQLALGLVLADRWGRVLFTNPRAERLLSGRAASLPPDLRRFVEVVIQAEDGAATGRASLPGRRNPVSVRGTRLPGAAEHVLVTLREQTPRPDLAKRLIERFGVSARSVRLVELARRGLTNKEIGDALRLSEATVKTYMHGVFRDLGVRNRAELVALAERLAHAS